MNTTTAENKVRYATTSHNFSKIPGSPIAYWVSPVFMTVFENQMLRETTIFKEGLTTANNDLFLKLWFEVDKRKFSPMTDKDYKWIPYNKGGTYRKWYGNREYVVNWESDGALIRKYPGSSFRNPQFQRLEGGTYSALSSSLSVRYTEGGFAFDSKGTMLFNKENLKYVISYMNTKVFDKILEIVCPTLDFRFGTIEKMPIVYSAEQRDKVISIAEENIRLSKSDWDSFEASWDFKKHPLI